MTRPPDPTPIFRIVHLDNLAPCLDEGGLWAPNHAPAKGRSWRAIHNVELQTKRGDRPVPCGPGGSLHDYVPFYLGPRSPMLFQLHTGQVAGYQDGQDPLIYFTSTVQRVEAAGLRFVFSNGHGFARFTDWFDDPARLGTDLDWAAVYARQWNDTPEDPDRQRRKQAEFLVHRFCPWALIDRVAVVSTVAEGRVTEIFAGVDPALRRPVEVRRDWYY